MSKDFTKITADTIENSIIGYNAASNELETWNTAALVSRLSLPAVVSSGSYIDLVGTPIFGTAAFTSSAIYATAAQGAKADSALQMQIQPDWNATSGMASVMNKPILATVATSGNYSDLIGTPTIPGGQVNGDWNAASGAAHILNKPSFSAVALSGHYDDILSLPTLGTAASTDISAYATAAQGAKADTALQTQIQSDWNATTGMAKILNKPALTTVATSGSYLDLTNKPTIPGAQISSDWNATSGVSMILNKPSLATVATTGSFNDLSNKPTLAIVATTGSYVDLSNKPAFGTAATMDANVFATIAQGTLAENSIQKNTVFEEEIPITLGGTLINATYYLVQKAKHAGTITGFIASCASLVTPGSYTIRINNTAVVGLSGITNTTISTEIAAISANTFEVGDTVTITFAGSLTLVNFQGQLSTVRILS